MIARRVCRPNTDNQQGNLKKIADQVLVCFFAGRPSRMSKPHLRKFISLLYYYEVQFIESVDRFLFDSLTNALHCEQ